MELGPTVHSQVHWDLTDAPAAAFRALEQQGHTKRVRPGRGRLTRSMAAMSHRTMRSHILPAKSAPAPPAASITMCKSSSFLPHCGLNKCKSRYSLLPDLHLLEVLGGRGHSRHAATFAPNPRPLTCSIGDAACMQRLDSTAQASRLCGIMSFRIAPRVG